MNNQQIFMVMLAIKIFASSVFASASEFPDNVCTRVAYGVCCCRVCSVDSFTRDTSTHVACCCSICSGVPALGLYGLAKSSTGLVSGCLLSSAGLCTCASGIGVCALAALAVEHSARVKLPSNVPSQQSMK